MKPLSALYATAPMRPKTVQGKLYLDSYDGLDVDTLKPKGSDLKNEQVTSKFVFLMCFLAGKFIGLAFAGFL